MAFRESQPSLKYSLEGRLIGAIDLVCTKPLDYTRIAAFHCEDIKPKKVGVGVVPVSVPIVDRHEAWWNPPCCFG